jgi:hypothetical protein
MTADRCRRDLCRACARGPLLRRPSYVPLSASCETARGLFQFVEYAFPLPPFFPEPFPRDSTGRPRCGFGLSSISFSANTMMRLSFEISLASRANTSSWDCEAGSILGLVCSAMLVASAIPVQSHSLTSNEVWSGRGCAGAVCGAGKSRSRCPALNIFQTPRGSSLGFPHPMLSSLALSPVP